MPGTSPNPLRPCGIRNLPCPKGGVYLKIRDASLILKARTKSLYSGKIYQQSQRLTTE